MDTMTVVYSFADMHVFGDGVDRIGMSPAFQDIVTRADELGTLFGSRVLRAIG